MSEIEDDKPLTAGDLRTILKDRSRFMKNGESWGEYIKEKWLTPQNIVVGLSIVAHALFSLGGSLERAQTSLNNAVKAANDAVETQKTWVARMSTYEQSTAAQQHAIKELQEATLENTGELAKVKDRIGLTVTRSEWRQVMDGNAHIIRRLGDIEKAAKQ